MNQARLKLTFTALAIIGLTGIMTVFMWNLVQLSIHLNDAAKTIADVHQPPRPKSIGDDIVSSNIRHKDSNPSLCYGFLIYQKSTMSAGEAFAQFSRLFNAVYDSHQLYIIHLDLKSSDELRNYIDKMVHGLGNVYVIKPETVSWAGVTVVERTIALMDKAIDVDHDWTHFVAIGQEDYPLERNDYIVKALTRSPYNNFLYCWDIDNHNFFGQVEKHGFRVGTVFFDDFVSQSHFAGWNRPALAGVKFYKTLQQMILSRAFVEYTARSSESRRLLLFMANTLAPDETFLVTLLMNSPFASDVDCDFSGHFSYWDRPGNSWHPEYMDMDYLPLLLRSGAFFCSQVPTWHVRLAPRQARRHPFHVPLHVRVSR
eukprot:Rmarinus@m.8322